MASMKLLLAIAVVACLIHGYVGQQCTASSTITTCSVPVIFYDQAPATMTHSRYPQGYFNVHAFYDWPQNGSCGTANGGMGWNPSDFELPLYVLQGFTSWSSTQYNNLIINGETGLVGALCTKADGSQTNCGVLNPADRTPIYAYGNNPSKTGQVSNATTFYDFFHLTPRTISVPYNLTLTQDPTNSRLRSFNNPFFFPLDGLGWNDWGPAPTGPGGSIVRHNFAFCMVMHTHFTYSGGETFYFIGDDDVYAFINGFLVMDIGGVHTAINGTINVDSLGLTKGSYNSFDFFYCERHTTSSEIAFETTINFFCAYTDWCGVCDGDGSSCCNNACNDNNACTTDACGVLTPPPQGCVHNQTVCPANTPCTTYACNTTTGACVGTPVNCNDNNDCTTDSCGAAGCQNLPINCAVTNNACVTTGCNKVGGCYQNPVTCTNTNMCKTISCDPAVGCVTAPINCTATDACHTAVCNPSSGCVRTDISSSCATTNKCATGSCDPVLGCVTSKNTLAAVCGSNAISNACVQYSCDPVKGCVTTYTTCTAPDACTAANCDPVSGCQYTPNVTCTGNACFTSACNKQTGQCVQTPKPACPSQPCLVPRCDNTLGCVYSPQNCTASGPCQQPSCQNGVCINTPIKGTAACGLCNGANCTFTDPCFPSVCVNNTKCVVQPVQCNDANACTTDTCVNVGGAAQCQYTPITCNQGDACHPQSCVNGSCVFNNVTCNDNNACTTDSCVISGSSFNCQFTPIVCTSSDQFCNPVKCSNGICVNDTANIPDCSDGNNCTYDVCSNGACSNPLVCPDSGTLCNPIVCEAGVCVNNSVNCDSGNLCTNDYCNATTGECVFTPIDCGGTTCNPSSCNVSTGLCDIPPLIDCNDSNPCTVDSRQCTTSVGFTCNNTNMGWQCNDSNVCTNDYCNASSSSLTVAGACYHTNVTCPAPSICQVITGCDPVLGCQYAPKNCTANVTDWCQVGVCDAIAGCITVARACAPQDNFCFAGFCDNRTRTCAQQQRPNWQTITNSQGVTCLLAYNTAAKAGLTAGIIAAIVIAAVVAAALIIIAGKKGVDIYMASRAAPIGAASNNPLYAQAPGSGTSALYGR